MRLTLALVVILCVFNPPLSVAAESPDATMTMATLQGASLLPRKPMLQEAIDREIARIRPVPPPSRSGESLAPQQASQNRSWIGRHTALFGALVGAGAGAVSAATMENELFCSGGDEDCFFHGGGRVLVGAGMGAGVGAVAGWLVGLGSK